MPILHEETDLFPCNLLDEQEPDSLMPPGEWRVLYTKPRHEKSVARHLLAHEVPFYLPLQRKTAFYRGRTITSLMPIFPSYVFSFTSDDQTDIPWKANHVISMLNVHDGEQLRRELLQIRQLVECGTPVTLESRIVPGNRVRVRLGSLAGLEGTVLKRHGETRLLVSVHFLQRGASVAIDDYMLEVI